MFNAAAHLGQNVAEITKKFDSVQFCFSKGLGAPVGSMIVGKSEFIERCRVIRKMLGGGMRQVGVIAAAARSRWKRDRSDCTSIMRMRKLLAQGLAKIPRIRIQPEKVQTNIVIYDIGETGLDATEFLKRLRQRNVLGGAVDARRVRMVTHLDVDRGDIEQTLRRSVR